MPLARRVPRGLVVAVALAACGPLRGGEPLVEPVPPSVPISAAPSAPGEMTTPSSGASPSQEDGAEADPFAPSEPAAPGAPSIVAYLGPGAWVDMYSRTAHADPEAAVATMATHGVSTLYLETSSYRRPAPIVRRERIERFIHAAHDRGIRVVAWYLPKFADVEMDLLRVMAAVSLRTARGDGFDSFALDIEADLVPAPQRIRNMLDLSARIRRAVGPQYPLGAIIPSPRGMLRVPDYWPGFPFDRLPDFYDVILPMSYFTFRYDDPAETYRYIRDNVALVQAGARGSVPVHVIGGLTEDMSAAESDAFVAAVVDASVAGASLYEFSGSDLVHWDALSRVPVTGG